MIEIQDGQETDDPTPKPGGQIKDGCMIDTYNQQIQYDVSCTIRTNINTANHHFIANMEEIQEPQVARMCSRNPENPSDRGKSNGRFVQMLELKHDGTSNTLTSVQKDNLVVEQSRYRIRKLTPRECFRLMDVDEDVIDKIQAAGISNSQQYKLAGNSIVVACLEKIFEQMFFPEYTNSRTLFG